jgi:integrase
MATAECKLAKRLNRDGKGEVIVRLTINRTSRPSFRSGVFVRPDFFKPVRETGKGEVWDITIPHRSKFNPLDVAEAMKAKQDLDEYISRLIAICNNLELQGRKELLTRDFIIKTYEKTKDFTIKQISETPLDSIQNMVPTECDEDDDFRSKSFFEQAEYYLDNSKLSEGRKRVYRVVFRALSRFQGYVRAMNVHRRNFELNIDTLDRLTLEEFFRYLENESDLQKKHKTLFKQLVAATPPEIITGHLVREISPRGSNVIVDKKKCLKAYFNWLLEKGYTKNNPFVGIKIGSQRFGTPYYITIDERKTIANADLQKFWPDFVKQEKEEALQNGTEFKILPLSTCLTQRDIFVFQCLIGCRVGDLMKLKPENIVLGVLNYIPRKTIEDKPFVVKVPLLPEALELIDKYKGKDAKGRLFPFIAPQNYNEAIKQIMKMCGITRLVTVRDSLTGGEKQVRICDVASSHMARRTFVGNLYKQVKDPNLIASMSGHAEGSQAFNRYREVDMDIKQEIIKGLE